MEQNILKTVELKTTQKRRLLLLLLQKQQRPTTAEELYEKVKPLVAINLSTVYRNLNTLTEKGILSRSISQDGKAYYSLLSQGHGHRLFCTSCNDIISIDSCPLGELQEKLEKETGYRILDHSLEFKGLCPKCLSKIDK